MTLKIPLVIPKVVTARNKAGRLSVFFPLCLARHLADADISDRHKNSRRLHRGLQEAKSKPSSNDNDSMKPNVGEGVDTISSFRPLSAPGSVRDPQMHIDDIEHLTLDPTGIAANEYRRGEHTSTSVNPLKRGAVGDLEAREFPQEQALEQKAASNRRTKALSGGPFIGKDGDPDFKRESPRSPPEYNPSSYSPSPGKRLYDPNTDDPNSNPASRRAKQEPGTAARRFYDSRAHVFRSRKVNKKDDIQPKIIVNSNPRSRPPPVNVERPPQPVKLEESLWHTQNTSGLPISDKDLSPEPEILLQPETKPITHEQLVVEVKGIYAGLIMVEAKCMDVDAKQLNAAREENPSRRTKLSDEQWQTLIVLHKTLLHEHHDFFLASQHPSANLALSRLPAKYSMPTRMWRYGIQAFLEVLRHRLPESLEHMLAFIYIAYSMMALLYETVTLFEDIWIECLGDLGRYRMGIEDDIRDRDVWCGVARFWYIKAANKNPKTGRLYHHLGILARPHTLQQLSYYAKSLTCEIPFENARSSIMTHFNPILNGKETAFRSSVFETKFIKAHGILFTNGALDEFDTIVHDIVEGMLDNYIGRIAAKFKEQGVYVAETCIAAMFEYGLMDSSESPGSLFRLAYVETEKIQTEKLTQISHSTNGENSEDTESTTLVGSMNSSLIPSESITSSKHASSVDIVLHASKLAFGVLSVALQRVGDRNVFPLVHMFFVFLWSLSAVEKAMQYVQQDIPWDDICSFLTNTAVKSDSWNSKAWGEHFPKSELGPSRPLPEDHIMRDKIYAQRYFPETWFTDAAIDDEERALELPSMAAPRIERIQWLGLRIASVCSSRFITLCKLTCASSISG